MGPRVQQEAAAIYHRLLQSQAVLQQLDFNEPFATPTKEVIYRRGKLILYHYPSQAKKTFPTPLLIVFALVNRPNILDLSPDNSFISNLTKAGRDIYLIDWGSPDHTDKNISLADYIIHDIKACIQKIIALRKQQKIDLLGVCQGGVFSLCYASLFPKEIRRLILLSTPVDFQTKKDTLSRIAKEINVEAITQLTGNLPGVWLSQIFSAIQPQLSGKKHLSFFDHVEDAAWMKRFFLVEKWLQDTPDQAGRAFCEFVKWLYQQNALLHGKLILDKQCVDLKAITMPVLNVIARDDYIVPPLASRVLNKYIGSKDYSMRTLPGGHIGIYVSQKTCKRLPAMIAAWLKKRELEIRMSGESHGRKTTGKNKRRSR